jgi:predicted MFS family arabinose efflux permease
MLFAAIFVAELGWSSVAPLIPDFQDRYGLSEARAGLVFSVASLGILIASLPAGALSRRLSVRTMTLWAMGSLVVANVLLGVANDFGVVLAGRLLWGVGMGTMWVACTAWLHDATGEHAARALAMTTAIVGIGALLGPAFAGFMAEAISLGAPFFVLATVAFAMTLALLLLPTQVGRHPEPGPPFTEMLRAVRSDHLMLTSIVLTLAVSMAWMTADLLVPLRLDDHGYSAAEIGMALSLASVIFVTMSALTARHAERYATTRISAAWTLVTGAAIAIAAASTSVPATLAFLVICGGASGVLIALTYPLGVIGARRGHFSVAIVGALLNMVWAGAGLVGPTVGGGLAQEFGDQTAFLAIAVIAVVSAGWMWTRRDREPADPVHATEA